MDDKNAAAANSRHRHEGTPDLLVATNPSSELRLFGVAAERLRIADALENLVKENVRIADAIENQKPSVIQALPPVALSYKDAAQYIGVGVPTIEHLVRSGKLPCIKHGKQRVRSICVEDLRNYATQHRQALDEERPFRKRRS